MYKFFKSREIEGKIKTLTVKRSATGEMYINVVTDAVSESMGVVTGNSAGFDFGLKTFLSVSDGDQYKSPLWMRKASCR